MSSVLLLIAGSWMVPGLPRYCGLTKPCIDCSMNAGVNHLPTVVKGTSHIHMTQAAGAFGSEDGGRLRPGACRPSTGAGEPAAAAALAPWKKLGLPLGDLRAGQPGGLAFCILTRRKSPFMGSALAGSNLPSSVATAPACAHQAAGLHQGARVAAGDLRAGQAEPRLRRATLAARGF